MIVIRQVLGGNMQFRNSTQFEKLKCKIFMLFNYVFNQFLNSGLIGSKIIGLCIWNRFTNVF